MLGLDQPQGTLKSCAQMPEGFLQIFSISLNLTQLEPAFFSAGVLTELVLNRDDRLIVWKSLFLHFAQDTAVKNDSVNAKQTSTRCIIFLRGSELKN